MNLTKEQKMAVCEINHNLQIIACAGSGKTEVITRRIAYILRHKPDISPGNIVAFTFTEKAAELMKIRIRKVLEENHYSSLDDLNYMYVGTIHGFCYHLLKQCCDAFNHFKVLDAVKSHLFVSRYHSSCGISDLELEPHSNGIKLFLECIEKMAGDFDNKESWDLKHQEIFEKYRSCLFEHGYLDFSMLIFETIQQIKNNPDVKKYISSKKYLVVDEYQDVDDSQEKLIEYFSDFGSNVCVVGDDDQTIYQFRGSNANNMIGFIEKYPFVTQVRLENNFRCGREIVDIADCVIKNNQNRIPKKMISKAKTQDIITTARRFTSQDEQYRQIANEIANIYQQGVSYSDVAILVRKGKYINSICAILEKQGIPYITNSTENFFTGYYFERFAKTMEYFSNMDKAILHDCWQGYIDDAELKNGINYLRQVARSGGTGYTVPISDIMKEFLSRVDFFNQNIEDFDNRLADFSGFITIVSDYDEIYKNQQLSARVTGLLKFLNTRAVDEYKYHCFKSNEMNPDAIHIMTVHKSKGLEFNTVFLPDLEESEFPAKNIGGKKYWHVLGGVFEDNKKRFYSDIEDERKLFYVAVTRSKENLFLYYDLSKKNLSPFVKEAALSKYLNIDPEDLVYEIHQKKDSVKTLKKKVMDFYGTAMCNGFPAAGADLVRVNRMNEEELRQEASKLGLC